jgi:16S rRNA (cytosine967-C5)-methyltransferase
MKYFSYINSAIKILQEYDGKEPFSYFIKNFFKQNKKFGSTDRRTINHLCYSYFRLGHALKDISVEEKILNGIFLCGDKPDELLNYLKPEWNSNIHLSLAEKLSILNDPFSVTDIFPWKEQLSEAIDHKKFCESFLTQPDLFLRIRPGNEEIVEKKLANANIEFKQISNSCIALTNSSKLEGIIDINKEAVIQDLNSQQVGKFFELQTTNHKPQTAWDCCAASGGKSIMLYDINPRIELTVSDIRGSILINLKKRFAEAGIKNYHSFIADLASTKHKPSAEYDLIIADLPCSGSGTWSRTPEEASFFNENEIERYSQLQKKIVANVIPSLKREGMFVYITCSVFKKDNEEAVDFIQKQFSMEIIKTETLKGYNRKADTMFAASLRFVN